MRLEEKRGFQDDIGQVMVEPYLFGQSKARERVKELFSNGQAGLNVKFVADLSLNRTMKVRDSKCAHDGFGSVCLLQVLPNGQGSERCERVSSNITGDYLKKAIFEEIIPK